MEALNKSGLFQFVAMITEKGWINVNTGNSWKAAVAKILADVEPEADVRAIDIDMAIRRFNNLHPGDLSPESLGTYAKRVKNAISNYVSYVEDPQKYRPPARTSSTNGAIKKTEKPKREASENVTDVTVIEAIPPAPPPSHAARVEQFIATEANLALPFPLRPGYLAQIVIPRDMTTSEADRLCAFIKTLATVE